MGYKVVKKFVVFAAVAMFAVVLVGDANRVSAQSKFEPEAGSSGSWMVRLLAAKVITDENVNSILNNGAAIAGADANVSEQFIPAATISYFFNDNIAVELFCCLSTHEITGAGALSGVGDLADTWIFPPIVTLQYHFTGLGSIKPYVGAGVNYTLFFDEQVGDGAAANLNATSVEIDDTWGWALQAGVDFAIGNNLSLNLDVKKVWMNTEATWTTPTGPIVADVDLDPWIVSVGLGYRFNMSDLFGG